jgi:hypothetical protein
MISPVPDPTGLSMSQSHTYGALRGIGAHVLGGAFEPYTRFIPPVNTLEWLARVDTVGGTVTVSQVMAVSRFISALNSLGITDTNARVSGFVGTNLAAAMVPVFKGPGPDSDTNVGFTASDFYPQKGILGTQGTLAGSYMLTGCYADQFNIPDRMLSTWVTEHYGITFCGLIGCDGDGTGTGICTHGWWLNGSGSYPNPYNNIGYNQSSGCDGPATSNIQVESLWVGGIAEGASPNTNIYVNGVKQATDYTYNDTGPMPHNEIGVMCFNRWSSTGHGYVTSSDLVRGYAMGVNPTSQAMYYQVWLEFRRALLCSGL